MRSGGRSRRDPRCSARPRTRRTRPPRAASTALPPSARMRSAAATSSGCPAATAPRARSAIGRDRLWRDLDQRRHRSPSSAVATRSWTWSRLSARAPMQPKPSATRAKVRGGCVRAQGGYVGCEHRVADLAVAAVVPDDERERRAEVAGRCEFLEREEDAPVAGEREHRTIGRREARADRHREGAFPGSRSRSASATSPGSRRRARGSRRSPAASSRPRRCGRRGARRRAPARAGGGRRSHPASAGRTQRRRRVLRRPTRRVQRWSREALPRGPRGRQRRRRRARRRRASWRRGRRRRGRRG